jgi:hypothetical protein
MSNQDAEIKWAAGNVDRHSDESRIRNLLASPESVGSKLVSLITELNQKAVHSYGLRGEYRLPIVEHKWQVLDQMVARRKTELNDAGVFVFVGGSLLYQDPSDNPDYDVVLFSFSQNAQALNLGVRIESDLYDLDSEVRIVDVVPVNLESLTVLTDAWQKGEVGKDHMCRGDLHYLNHVLTGFPVFVPSRYSQGITDDLRTHIICDYYSKSPVLGAAAVVDLENVIRVRKQKAARKL